MPQQVKLNIVLASDNSAFFDAVQAEVKRTKQVWGEALEVSISEARNSETLNALISSSYRTLVVAESSFLESLLDSSLKRNLALNSGITVFVYSDEKNAPAENLSWLSSSHFCASTKELSQALSVYFSLMSRSLTTNPRLQGLANLMGGDMSTVFGSVHDSLREGVVCCDVDGRVIYANLAFEDICGFSLAEMEGKRIYEFLFPRDLQNRESIIDAQHKRYQERLEGKNEEYELFITTIEGELRSLEVKASPLRLAGGEVVGSIGVIADVSERKLIEQQLTWSQKMEAVGRLAGGVAHDFNNLLTVIRGYSAMLLKSFAKTDVNHRRVSAIIEAGESATLLTQQLLTLSRRQIVNQEVIGLNEVVEQSKGIISGLVGSDIEVEIQHDGNDAFVRADKGQLQQVILNLAINARDAMLDGGTLYISTRVRRIESRRTLSHAVLEPGDYAVLEVRDAGIGMDDVVKAHLFEPFFTTKKEGTGLGLSTVYGIVKQHKGAISLNTSLGKGTTFRLFLPIAQANATITRKKVFEEVHEGTGTLLIVEDEENVRLLIREMLTDSGYFVIEAADGEAALAIFEKESANIDLVLSDVVMPRLDGMLLARKIIEIAPEMPLVLMSGCTSDLRISEEILRLGVPFLAKPFDQKQLLEKVALILEQRSSSDTPRLTANLS